MTEDYIVGVLRDKWRHCLWAVTAFAALRELEPIRVSCELIEIG